MASESVEAILHFDSSSSPCTKFFNLKQIVGQGGEAEVSLAASLKGLISKSSIKHASVSCFSLRL